MYVPTSPLYQLIDTELIGSSVKIITGLNLNPTDPFPAISSVSAISSCS